VLSAYGLTGAELVEENQVPAASVLVKAASNSLECDAVQRVWEVLKDIAAAATARLSRRAKLNLDELVVTPYLNLRFHGTDFAMMTAGPSVPASSLELLRSSISSYPSNFRQRYKTEFGFDLSNRDIIVDDISEFAHLHQPFFFILFIRSASIDSDVHYLRSSSLHPADFICPAPFTMRCA
jgi:5-oxoprolinase (ATP-hydrolysing)